MDRNARKNFIIDTIFTVIIILLIFLVCFVLLKYLLPFVIAAVIGFLVQKPAKSLCRKLRFKEGNIAAVLSVVIYLAFGTVLCFFIYKLAHFLIGLTELLPVLFKKINVSFGELSNKYSDIFSYISKNFNISAEELVGNSLQKLIDVFGVWVSNFAKGIIKNVPSFFIASIVTLVATCYISKDFAHLQKFLKLLIGKDKSQKIVKIKNIMVGSVFKLFKGYLILGLIVFAILYLGLLLLRVENAVSIAIIIALADLLPVIGTGTILIPWAVVMALSGNYYFAVSLAVLFIIVVLLRNFLEPKIIGKQIGINSLFTLATMFLGLKVLGIFGLFLFPIIFIVIVKYYKDEMELSQ